MQPEERVQAFIADFHRSQSELKQHPDDAQQFDRWYALVEALDKTHFIDQGGIELSQVIHGGESPHTLEAEPIVSVKRGRPCICRDSRRRGGGDVLRIRVARGERWGLAIRAATRIPGPGRRAVQGLG